MKMCQAHWDKLRQAIEDRGLSRLVSKDGEELARRLTVETDPKHTFEPLMSAHAAIIGNALQAAGLAVMSPNEDGSERCPLCYLASLCELPSCPKPCQHFEKWIEFASNDGLMVQT